MTTYTSAPPLHGIMRWAWWTGVGALVLVGLLWTFLSMGLAFERAGGEVRPWLVWLYLGCLAVPVQPMLLVWSRRRPVQVGYVTVLLSLLWPLGWFVPVAAWALAIVYAPDRPDSQGDEEGAPEDGDVPVIGLLVLVSTWWIVWRDSAQSTDRGSLFKLLLHAAPTEGQAVETSDPLPWWFAVVFTLTLVTVVGVLASWVRSRADGARARARSVALEEERDGTRLALGRQVERERIAREVHDTLGHRLSLLSVHAGALELQTEGRDDELSRSAALVREHASRSMDDLRSLVGLLREAPEGLEPPDLADLPAMIDEAVAAGDPVVATVYLDGAEGADPVLARAVYRIVQELLTNARKHAPGQVVRLVVQGSPGQGVTIEASNPLVNGAPSGVGSGLAGLRERVELLAGTVEVDRGERLFAVRAWLPWRTPHPG
ncbi:sensor histidine kinase [Kytococcus sedentarius]|uniref:sensor histidine kinase n=1 Tax=Kytococcus sedentarius TaxID=1276 RepID=UPI0035BBB35A